MSDRQVIWLNDAATSFTALCEECLAERQDVSGPFGYRAAKVTGRLRQDADVGFTRCDRGHPISVRRISPAAA